MTIKTQSTTSKMYASLLAHCQKQYKNISKIEAAYIKAGQVFGIDYISKAGFSSIASNTFDCDTIVRFK